jgi:hypothetical protein
MKTTAYFRHVRQRQDRVRIQDVWIERAIREAVSERVQEDGRVQRWVYISEERRYLRVVLLADRQTVHNAFFDRGFKP